jgi:pSer/pThr/pTyr-binding forkhead associated (FHA) protein
LANDQDALVCEYCGTVFVDLHLESYETTKNVTNRRATDLLNENQQTLKSPSHGMAFFLFGKTEPLAVFDEDVIYLGRLDKDSKETTREAFVDLALAAGFTQGVSRRHAMIHRQDNRVELMDLHSSNGTFLNGNRLLPSKFYELKSGTVIQLGRLKLIAIFSWIANR